MNEENIFGFIDGDLSRDQEKELFRDLAENDSLRDKLRTAYAMNGEISKNAAHFAPSSVAAASLFTTLGINAIPAQAANTSAPANNVATKNGYFSKYFNRPSAIVAIASALLTSLLFLAFQNKATEFAAIEKKVQVPVYVQAETAAPKIVEKTKYIVKTVYRDRPINLTENTVADNAQAASSETAMTTAVDSKELSSQPVAVAPEVAIETSRIANKIVAVNLTDNPNLGSSAFGMNGSSQEPLLPGQNPKEKNFMLELRGAGYYNSPKETIMPSYLATFDNMAITGLYRVYKEFRIGADLRRERFFQVFKGENALGENVTIEQQPNYTSICLALRYDFTILDKVRLYTQGQTGFAKGTWVNRGGFGLSYELGSGISAMIGIERSLQTFKSGSDYYLSIKNSLQYGLNCRF